MKPETAGRWVEFEDRDRWLGARTGVIGSSDVPALVGLGYSGQNAVTVYANKRGGAEQRFTKDQRKRFEMGRIGERFVLDMFAAEKENKPVHTALPAICYHPVIEFIGASLDAFVVVDGEHRAVEAKMVGPDAWADWADDLPPVRHAVQLQHQLMCTGWRRGYLVGWTGRELKIYEQERKDDLIELLEQKIARFWSDHVIAGVVPELDGSEATAEALRMLWPRDSGTVMELGDGELEEFRRIRALDEEIKRLEKEQSLAKSKIKAVMEEATYAVFPDGSAASWKWQERKAYSVDAGESRVFRKHDRLPKGVASLPTVRPKRNPDTPMVV